MKLKTPNLIYYRVYPRHRCCFIKHARGFMFDEIAIKGVTMILILDGSETENSLEQGHAPRPFTRSVPVFSIESDVL